MIAAYVPLIITVVGTGLLGLSASVLGVFATLRRQSLIGDAVSHAALPGIVMAFMITQSRDPFILMIGGGIAGTIGALAARSIMYYVKLAYDAVLGIILSVFFGIGLILLTMVQKTEASDQAILGKFLFGNAATLLMYDMIVLASIALLICICIYCIWKECKLLAFDEQFAYSCGYPVRALDVFLTVLTVITIVVGLHLVGVLLMSSFFIAPAAAARQWTARLEPMVAVASVFGIVSSISGTLVSSSMPHVPTGPAIVIVMSICVLISLLFAPHRGIVSSRIRKRHKI